MKTVVFILGLGLLLGACGGSGDNHHDHDMPADQGYEEIAADEMESHADVVPVPDELSEVFDGVLNRYLHLTEVLVASDADEAATAADELHDAAAQFDDLDAGEEWTDRLDDWRVMLSQRSGAIAEATDVDDQRRDYEALSETIITMVEHLGHQKGTLYHQRCPMVNGGNGDWLSTEERILNPYHGERMLNCGSTIRML